MKSYKKGFTLIELLVVIAIIGILAAIVFVNVSSARNKAKDAGVKGNLSSFATAAELRYDTQSSYADVCAFASSKSAYDAAIAASGSATKNCADEAGTYVACVGLATDSDNAWCTDNTGVKGKVTNAVCTDATTTCGTVIP